MIANKVLPAHYALDLQGDAASLEQIFKTKHKIRRVVIISDRFDSDVQAAAAGREVFDHFTQDLNGEVVEKFNPEFFPTQPEIEPTLEQLHVEEIVQAKLDQMKVESIALTHRFDEWGDHVAVRTEMEGDSFKATMRAVVSVNSYALQKNIEKQEYIASLHGLKSDPTPALVH